MDKVIRPSENEAGGKDAGVWLIRNDFEVTSVQLDGNDDLQVKVNAAKLGAEGQASAVAQAISSQFEGARVDPGAGRDEIIVSIPKDDHDEFIAGFSEAVAANGMAVEGADLQHSHEISLFHESSPVQDGAIATFFDTLDRA